MNIFSQLKQGNKSPAASTSSSPQKPLPPSKTVTTPSGKKAKIRVIR